MGFGDSLRAAEDREGWKGIVATSSVVPQQPPRLRDWADEMRWWDEMSLTGWLCMPVWRMSLQRMKSTIISWDGSINFEILFFFVCEGVCMPLYSNDWNVHVWAIKIKRAWDHRYIPTSGYHLQSIHASISHAIISTNCSILNLILRQKKKKLCLL